MIQEAVRDPIGPPSWEEPHILRVRAKLTRDALQIASKRLHDSPTLMNLRGPWSYLRRFTVSPVNRLYRFSEGMPIFLEKRVEASTGIEPVYRIFNPLWSSDARPSLSQVPAHEKRNCSPESKSCPRSQEHQRFGAGKR